jgi:hypothetical protein
VEKQALLQTAHILGLKEELLSFLLIEAKSTENTWKL